MSISWKEELKGFKDYEPYPTRITIQTLKRCIAIAQKNNNLVDVDSMTVDIIINTALDRQNKKYDKLHDELNKFTKKIIKGE
jgi:hypothetical protein